MATTLIAILIVLLCTHALPDLARLRRFGWLHGPDSRSGGLAPWQRILLIAALALLVTALVQHGLKRDWFGLFELAFMIAVLYLSWGPRDLGIDVEAIVKAPDSERRQASAQRLHDSLRSEPVALTATGLVEAAFNAALSRWFGVLFWFVLLGPFGALAWRIVQLLARSPAFAEAMAPLRPRLEWLAKVLDWAPAHLLALSLALVSDFEAIFRAWLDYHREPGRGFFNLDTGFLAVIGHAGVDADIAAGDGGVVEGCDAMAELDDAHTVLRRALYLWVAVVGVIVLGGWAS